MPSPLPASISSVSEWTKDSVTAPLQSFEHRYVRHGSVVGDVEGADVGIGVGAEVGFAVGIAVGTVVGFAVGL